MLKFAALFALLATPALADVTLYFHSPSGNIHCLLTSGDYAGVRCDMVELTKSFPTPPADCDLDWGAAFAIGRNDPLGQVICHGDTIINPDGMELAYGASATLGDITCTSEPTGMTCSNAMGHGFAIAKARQKLF